MAGLTGSVHPLVLVMDDDDEVRDTIAQVLEARGFQTMTAPDTASALEACRVHHVDAIVADLSIPGDSRGTLTDSLRSAHSDVKVIYASGIPRHIALSAGLVQPNAPYLQKPVEFDVLTGLLRSLLQDQRAPSS
jgi:CheY-like chemotaxis protein